MPPLPLIRIQERMGKLKEWSLDGNMLVKELSIGDFQAAVVFAQKMSEIAARFQHQPILLIDPPLVRITLTSPQEGGLSQKDFDVAEQIDLLV